MIVADASILVPAITSVGPGADIAAARLDGEVLTAPDIVHLETASGIRSMVARREIDVRAANEAIVDLIALPIRLTAPRLLLPRCWELRETMTAYDAAYVALAELLDIVLVTADRGIARNRRKRCRVELLTD